VRSFGDQFLSGIDRPFGFLLLADFFTQTLNSMNPLSIALGQKQVNVDTPRRLPRRSRERAQKHFSEREYAEEYY
jgi:hypothetical protein